MADYEVKRWKRYGKDRLYIEHDGVRAGWYDVLTGTLTVELPGHDAMVSVVVDEWLAGNGIPVAPAGKPPHVDEQLGWVPPVTAALIFLTRTRTTRLTVKAPPDDVLVFPRSDVPGCFRKMGQVLTPAEADAIFEVARRSTTWL